jgi:hypothetical protein
LVAEEFLERCFSQLKRVEWERVIIFSVIDGNWVLAGPKWFFKRQPLPDVFQNAVVWRQTKGSNKLTVEPLGECKRCALRVGKLCGCRLWK